MDSPDYSWVKTVLGRYDPTADLSQGYDINHDGQVVGSEKLVDADLNGIVGDSQDWIDFLQRNPELRNPKSTAGFFARDWISFFKKKPESKGSISAVDFFRWGRAFKPTNPLHDLLSIEGEIEGAEKIRGAYKTVALILSRVRSRVEGKNLTPQEKLATVYSVMKEMGTDFKGQCEGLFAENIGRKSLDCDTSSDVVIAVAHEMGWPVSLMELPKHVFVRWDDDQMRFNMDLGKIRSDADYQKEYGGMYPRKLDRRATLSFYLSERGCTKQNLRDFAGAIEDDTQAIDLDPENAGAFTQRGGAKLGLDDFMGAIEDYTQAIVVDPTNAVSFVNRGITKAFLGDFKEAMTDFSKAIVLNPKDAEAFYCRGIALNDLGEYPGAIADFTQAIALDPKDAKALTYRGVAREALGNSKGSFFDAKIDYLRAIKDYTDAIALDPKNATAFFGRANARLYLGGNYWDFAYAMSDYEQAIALDPKNAAAFSNRGVLQYSAGLTAATPAPRVRESLENAIEDYTQAIALDPKDSEVFVNRAYAKIALGDVTGGIEDLRKAVELESGVKPENKK